LSTGQPSLIPPPQHLGIIKALWEQRGEPMPIAVALGVEPALPYVGGMPLPEGADESHYLGAYFGEPLDVVPAETVDLLVPATAEIVIEGHVSHTDVADEGPMGEYPGYLDRSSALPRPVLHVTAVTYSDQAILPVAVAGARREGPHRLGNATRRRNDPRAASGEPAGRRVLGVLESANHWWVVAVQPDWHEQTGLSSKQLAEQVGQTVFGAGKLAFGVPKLLLIENDIDIADPKQVIWAFASRAHPEHGEIHFANEPQNILPIYLDAHERLSYHATKIVHNCLIADRFDKNERPTPSDLTRAWPADIRQHVIDNWQTYGYR